MKNIRFGRPSSPAAAELKGLENAQPSSTGTPLQKLKYQILEFTNKTDGDYTVSFGDPLYKDLNLPAAENIIRAWSTRRLIPDYKEGIAIMADRAEPLGDDGFAVNFRPDGTILLPDGDDAYAYELHEQHGIADSKLINTVFANCPAVLANNIMKKGLDWSDKDGSTSNNLCMSPEDAEIETVFSGSFSLIVWAFLNNSNQNVFMRSSAGSGTWLIRSSSISANSIRLRLSENTDKTITPAAGNTYDGKWASFGIVVNRAPATPTYAVYLNGISIDTGDLAAPSVGYPTSLRISGYGTANAPAVNDLAIWDTALTDSQMQAAHDAMAPYYAI